MKKKKITDLKGSTKQKLHQKFERLQQKLEQWFAEAIAPGQSEELITSVLHFQNEDKNSEIPEDLLVLLQMYKDSDSLGKLVILLLVNHKRYNKEEIDHACKLEAENSGFSFRKSKNKRHIVILKKKLNIF